MYGEKETFHRVIVMAPHRGKQVKPGYMLACIQAFTWKQFEGEEAKF